MVGASLKTVSEEDVTCYPGGGDFALLSNQNQKTKNNKKNL